MARDGWERKFKGSRERGGAWIHTHPDIADAIVENQFGFRFRGEEHPGIEEAKKAALSSVRNKED